MPSGAKKRKAAKKKKEQATNAINSSNNPHGSDDPRSQDGRDSDGGEAGSRASQDDHNQQHAYSQGKDEGERSQSHLTEEKSEEEATKDTENTEKSGLGVDVKIEKGWEPKNDLESSHVSIQHVELDKSSSSSSSRKSSCSSSDEESRVSEKKSKEEASYNTENKSATVLAEDVSKVAEHGAFENGDSGYAGNIVAVDNAVKTALTMPEVSETTEKNSVPDVVEPGLKANEEKLLPSSNGISGVGLEGVEGKNFISWDVPTAETSNFAETNQTLEPHGYSEKQFGSQPLVPSTPPPVQGTSFLSCCGLFEVFTRSGR